MFHCVAYDLALAFYSNKWYHEQGCEKAMRKIILRYEDHARRLPERPIGARWSMTAITDAVGGVGHFGQEAWTVRWAVVGKDRLDVAIGSM